MPRKKDDSLYAEDSDDEEIEKVPIDILKLIYFVKKYPELYSPQHGRYSDHEHRNGIWESIAQEFGATVAVCKKKWNSVRDCYKRYLKRLAAGEKIPKYRYADILQFVFNDDLSGLQQNDGDGSDNNDEEDVEDSKELSIIREGIQYKTQEDPPIDILKLICFIKKYPELYSPQSSRYLDEEYKNGLWEDIAKEFQTSVELCKKKWNSVKECYKRYLKRLASGDKIPKYRYADILQFVFDDDLSGLELHHDEDVTDHNLRKKSKELSVIKEGMQSKTQEEFLRSYDATKCLIELIKPHPCLYDVTSSDYLNSQIKNNTWKKISKQIQCKVPLCKARWYNIRDNYRKSLRRRNKGDKKKYLYSKHLGWLASCLMTKRPLRVKSLQDSANDETVYDSDHLADDNMEEEHVVVKPRRKSHKRKNEAANKVANDFADNISDLPLDFIKQEAVNSDYFETVAFSQDEHLGTDSLNESSELNQDDAINAFLSSLAPTLKSLRPYYLNRAKTEIFSIVQKYELEMLLEKRPH